MQVQFGNYTGAVSPVQLGARSVSPQVQFGGRLDNILDGFRDRLPRRGGNSGPPQSPVKRVMSYAKWGLTAVAGMIALFNVGWDSNPNSTYSLVNQRYVGDGIGRNPDGTCKVQGPGLVFPLVFAENYKFDTRPQVVKMTFQPYTQDGVPVDGKGTPGEGIDFRITYSIMSDQDKAAYESGAPASLARGETPTYNRTICEINDGVVGSSRFNPGYSTLQGTVVEFVTSPDDDVMKMIFHTKILPHITQAFLTAANKVQVKDLQESRNEIERLVIEGLTEPVLDAEGQPLIDKDTNRPVTRTIIRPLREILAEANLRLDGAEVSTIDVPQFLAELNNRRTSLNIDMSNALLDITKAEEQQRTAPQTVAAQKAKDWQAQLGENARLKAERTQAQAEATEAAKRKLQEAEAYYNKVIAEARGYEQTKVLEAQSEAVQMLAAAYVLQQQKAAEAVAASAPILEKAKALNESLLALGLRLRENPNYLEQIKAQMTAAARTHLAGKIDSALLAPGTSPDDILDGITVDKVLRILQLHQATVDGPATERK